MRIDTKTWHIAAFIGLLLSSGCHLVAVGGTAGALIGGALADKPGAMIGGGAGLLGGATADVLLHMSYPGSHHSTCESFATTEERRACERGQIRAQDENLREGVSQAERYGYDLQRRYR